MCLLPPPFLVPISVSGVAEDPSRLNGVSVMLQNMLSADALCILPTSTLHFETCLIRKDYVIDTTIILASSIESVRHSIQDN